MCSACRAGQYDHDSSAASPCQSCAAGKFSSVGVTMCTACLAGWHDHDYSATTPCKSCTVGQFSPANATMCTKCVAGTADLDLSAATRCQNCAAGKFSVAGATTCTLCIAGQRCFIPVNNDVKFAQMVTQLKQTCSAPTTACVQASYCYVELYNLVKPGSRPGFTGTALLKTVLRCKNSKKCLKSCEAECGMAGIDFKIPDQVQCACWLQPSCISGCPTAERKNITKTIRRQCSQYVQNSVKAAATITLNLATIPPGSPERETFEKEFTSGVSAALRVSPERVTVLNIAAEPTGNVAQVNYNVLPDNGGKAVAATVITAAFATSKVSIGKYSTTKAISAADIAPAAPAPPPYVAGTASRAFAPPAPAPACVAASSTPSTVPPSVPSFSPIDCVESTKERTTCNKAGQELYSRSVAAANGGTACVGSSYKCSNNDVKFAQMVTQLKQTCSAPTTACVQASYCSVELYNLVKPGSRRGSTGTALLKTVLRCKNSKKCLKSCEAECGMAGIDFKIPDQVQCACWLQPSCISGCPTAERKNITKTIRRQCSQYVQNSVKAAATITLNLATIPPGSPERETFEKEFTSGVSAALRVSPERVTVLNIEAERRRQLTERRRLGNAVKVNYNVLPDNGGKAVAATVITAAFATSKVSIGKYSTTKAISAADIAPAAPAPPPYVAGTASRAFAPPAPAPTCGPLIPAGKVYNVGKTSTSPCER
eukprot:COSAG01_NODE_2317_length_7922_cov_18.384763_2_plen_714_part_00